MQCFQIENADFLKAEGRLACIEVAAVVCSSDRYGHDGPSVCLGDGQTEADGIMSNVDAATCCSGECPHTYLTSYKRSDVSTRLDFHLHSF